MQVEVIVKLKNGVLDPQGKAICHALHSLGHKNIEEVSVGKRILLEVKGEDKEEIKKEVEQMCQTLLANVVIEDYEVKL
ncbi:phosphoribosylformylglycinamidine synthase [Helicobacter valdiviensis]|uniref:Phosphoribosylformylglycinamidine synthase subunit PurS n=1 Tax=Helicobacter valdiviensis TaxID=1458358 RepID=A0A2W6MTL1_9HELI|nr:phosphoribosylformylglycinamidine synthase subunit PurS [Helicobacter valdiviensis]PZT47875.1 phosphoribosylformylglycinamidine synthase [Helicobacter valdiviensis]